MADSNERYLLKVLSGPHQGAEISLKDGEYLVGSSGDCDVILSDASLAPEHFKLTISGEDAKLVSMGEEVYVHGKLVHEEPVPVESFQFITVGSTQIVLGPSDEAWPAISAADAPALEKEEPTPEAGEDGAEGEGAPVAEGEPLMPGDTPAPAAGPPPAKGLKQKILGPIAHYLEHPFYVAHKFYIWVTTGLAIAALMGVAFFLTYTPPVPPPDLKAVEREVVKALSPLGFEHDIGVHVVDEQVFVYGYVDTDIQRRKVQILLEPFGSLVSMRVYSEDGIIQSARDVLAQFNLNLKISVIGPGRLKVEGYVMDSEVWTKAQALILQDVAGVESIDTNLISGKDVIAKANEVLQDNGLLRTVKISVQPRVIIAQGGIAPEQAPEWRKAKKDMEAFLHKWVPFQDRVAVSSSIDAEALYFDNKIRSINVDDPGWITLINGERYFEGATLPTGYLIISISAEGIRLRKGISDVFVKLKKL